MFFQIWVPALLSCGDLGKLSGLLSEFSSYTYKMGWREIQLTESLDGFIGKTYAKHLGQHLVPKSIPEV